MFTELLEKNLPGDARSSDAYNEFQLQHAKQTRYELTAETSVATSRELLRVLVVDDHRDGAKIMAMLVDVWGHHGRCAYDGASGLALAAEFQPHVVLLDLKMPNMSGFELATKLRQQAQLRECLILAVTGRTDAEDQRKCEAAGIDLLLIKPVSSCLLKALFNMESARVARIRQERVMPFVPASWFPNGMPAQFLATAKVSYDITEMALAT